jgi:hypothetical protein
VAVGAAFFHLHGAGAVVVDPVDAHLGVELGAEAGGEEAVAEEAARGVEDEDDELGFADGEAVGAGEFGEIADYGVDVFNVVDG